MEKLFTKEKLLFIDTVAVISVIWNVILGIDIYFWGITITPFSFCNLYEHWSVAWVFIRFSYQSLKAARQSKP